jgi:hypothetical protein
VNPGAAGVTKVALATAATSAVIKPLTNGTTYYFVVTAVNSNGEGGVSSEKSIAPDALLVKPASPNGVVLIPGAGKITVQWNTKPTATTYNIYYAATASTTTAVLLASGIKVIVPALSVDPQALTQSFDISGLATGSSYSFVVTSENTAGESGAQNAPKTDIVL